MNSRERGFLLLSSDLGDPRRRPLSTAQLRLLADRAWQMEVAEPERPLGVRDLTALGYGKAEAERILALLSQEDVLDHYLTCGRRAGCLPITRVSEGYPRQLRLRLGLDSPGVLWARGNVELLRRPAVALVGSRELREPNREFARQVGRQAARQGYTLVSGNARGADREAQNACLAAGGTVICVAADALVGKPERPDVLWLCEDSFDREFSAQRALSRNRCIHALAERTFVAQSGLGTGGTWDGTVRNLRGGWSPVFCFDDGSDAAGELIRMGAAAVGPEDLQRIDELWAEMPSLFDQ